MTEFKFIFTKCTIPPTHPTHTHRHGAIREYNLVLYTYIFNALTVFELSNIAFHTWCMYSVLRWHLKSGLYFSWYSAIVVGTLHYVLTLVTSTVKLYKHLHKKIKQGNKNDHLERWSVFLIMKKNRTRLKQYNTMLFPYWKTNFIDRKPCKQNKNWKKNDYHSFRFKTSDSNSRIYFSLRSDKNKLEIICWISEHQNIK